MNKKLLKKDKKGWEEQNKWIDKSMKSGLYCFTDQVSTQSRISPKIISKHNSASSETELCK